jgi:anti-anti-sigma factor
MAFETESTPGEVLFVSSHRDGRVTVVKLAGELDLHGTERLAAEVKSALVGSDLVEIDAEELTFADSAGLRAVLLARAEAERGGAVLRVSKVSASVGRVIEIAGLADELLPAPS